MTSWTSTTHPRTYLQAVLTYSRSMILHQRARISWKHQTITPQQTTKLWKSRSHPHQTLKQWDTPKKTENDSRSLQPSPISLTTSTYPTRPRKKPRKWNWTTKHLSTNWTLRARAQLTALTPTVIFPQDQPKTPFRQQPETSTRPISPSSTYKWNTISRKWLPPFSTRPRKPPSGMRLNRKSLKLYTMKTWTFNRARSPSL
jgi:hypothetical protein